MQRQTMLVRPMTLADTQAVASLTGELGYPATLDEIRERFRVIVCLPDHAFFVADQEGTVIGWVQMFGIHLLASPQPFAEIGGLVVDATVRRQGIGSALVARAEQWAREHGYPEVRLRSGVHRTEAHQFYEQIGYALTKTGHMFRKEL